MTSIQTTKKNNRALSSFDFDLLLSHALKKPKEFLHTHPEYHLTLFERLRLAYFLFRYRRGYSVAAITHHKEFYGLDFYVNKHTLIPRPETELIVEEAISNIQYLISNRIPNNQNNKVILIDIGTGSGCIPIAICATLQQRSSTTPKTFGIDISPQALRVAKKNARRHNVDITFLHGNLLEPFTKHTNSTTAQQHNTLTIGQSNNRTIIITANLPYLTQNQFDNEPSIQREPRSALVAGNGGLALYEQLLKQIQSLLLLTPYSLLLFFEIDPSQTERIQTLIKKYLPKASIQIKKDLAGRDRIVKIVVK